MPFLTEELWQRLPRRPDDKCPSIVKAAYPAYQQLLDDEASEEAYELILGVSKSIRSLAAEYELKDNADIRVVLSSPQALETCNTQQTSIRSLGGKPMTGSSASLSIFSNDDPKFTPTGCVVQAVNAEAAVYLQIKGRVDIDAEIAKAKSRLWKANEAIEKVRKIRDGDGWSKMKTEAQESEEKKLEDAMKEAELLGGSVTQFERLKLE